MPEAGGVLVMVDTGTDTMPDLKVEGVSEVVMQLMDRDMVVALVTGLVSEHVAVTASVHPATARWV